MKTLTKLRLIDTAVTAAGAADFGWIVWTTLDAVRPSMTCDGLQPTTFSPVPAGPPAWLLVLGLIAFVILFWLSMMVVNPAIARARRLDGHPGAYWVPEHQPAPEGVIRRALCTVLDGTRIWGLLPSSLQVLVCGCPLCHGKTGAKS